MRSSLAAAGIALAALALYLGLGQNALHGLDAYHFLRFVQQGELHNPQLLLYQPCAWAWTRLLAPFGVPLYEAMRSLSAAAAALGVLGAHAVATALGMTPARARLCALGCAATPAVLDTATVVEVDALLFCCSALAWLPFARLLRSDRTALAVITGAATALAAAMHAAGHLLALSLCGLNLAWGLPARPLRTTAPRSLALAATHGALTLLLGWLAGAAGQATQASNTAGLAFRAGFVPHVLWHEWLLPYAPFCLLPLAALRVRELRAATAGLFACLGGYLLVTTLVLGLLEPTGPALPHGGAFEFGSFLLGATVPMVVLSIAALPLRAGAIAVALAAIAGVWQVRAHDWPPDPAGYAAGYAEVARREAVDLVVEGPQEWAWIARREPSVRCTMVPTMETEMRLGVDALHVAFAPEHVLLWFRQETERRRALGRSLLLTERALARMRSSAVRELATAVNDLLPAAFTLEPVAAQGFRAFRLQQR